MKNNFFENRATFGAWLPYRFILFGLPALFAICYFLCTTTSAACKKAPAARNTIQLVERQLRAIGGLAFAMTGIREFTIPAGVVELGRMNGAKSEGGTGNAFSLIGNETAVCGTPGSAAEEYCKRFGITFRPAEDAAAAE